MPWYSMAARRIRPFPTTTAVRGLLTVLYGFLVLVFVVTAELAEGAVVPERG